MSRSLRFKTKLKLLKFTRVSFSFLTAPVAIALLTYSYKVQPAYKMSWRKRMVLGYRFWRNSSKLVSGTSWRAHLVIAMRLLEIPPETEGVVVECGCWFGSATVNLSLICEITGRNLLIYDSFEGLPPPSPGDPVARLAFKDGFVPGAFAASLQEVTEAVRKYGSIGVCEFRKGWLENTLPLHEEDIVLAYWDVDYFASLHACLVNLWPHIVDGGMVFVDDYTNIDYLAVFYSEKFWDKYFSCAPPGLVGIGTGVQVGMFYYDHTLRRDPRMIQSPESTTYCTKGTKALWNYYPDEIETTEKD